MFDALAFRMYRLVDISPTDFARELREKWDALKRATLALRAVEDRPLHDPERLQYFALYQEASATYDDLLRRQIVD